MPNIYIFIAITRKDFTNATLSTTSGSFHRALFFKKSTAQPFFPTRGKKEKGQPLTSSVFLSTCINKSHRNVVD